MKQRGVLPDKRKIRNLKQYQDMSDSEFEEQFSESVASTSSIRELSERIDAKLVLMGEDYDMDDMKSNDKIQLRALAQAEIQLEDLENVAYTLRQDIQIDNVLVLEKVNNIMSKLRNDISMIQEDLQLTRKIRKESKEASVISYIDTLREKAKKFYKEKMLYIFCPECRMLLATIWLHYKDADSSVKLHCKHCNKDVKVSLVPLYDSGNRNLEDVTLP